MIGALAVIGLLHGLCAGLGVPAAWTPHFAAAATLWFGIRAAERTGVLFALLAGLVAGLFSSLAWAVEPLVCMVVLALTGGIRNVLSPASRSGFMLIATAVLLFTTAFEIIWRQTTAPLPSETRVALGMGLATRLIVTLAVLPIVVKILDRGSWSSRL